ncbi:MAG: extracellular solute-binding protein [Clostridia bacterium]|nr:extracellular solute-binding protein [Clostridia bacterium]
MKRFITLLLALVMLFAIMGTGTAVALDTSEYVELIVYQFGEPEADAQLVIDALNEKLKVDLNCTLKFYWIPWTEYQSTYAMLLTGGEPVDIVYTANWTPFVEHAQKGAFLPLEELLPAYAPICYSRFDEVDWVECSYDGHIYALPSYFTMVLPDGVMYRNDLIKKYGLDPINSVPTLEAYLQAVKDNEPDIIPFHLSGTLDRGVMQLFWFENNWAGFTPLLDKFLAYPVSAAQENLRDVFCYVDTPEFEEFCKMTKDWADKGFWSKSALSNQVPSYDSMPIGRSALSIAHLDRLKGDIGDKIFADNPEWEPTAWFPFDNLGYLFQAATLQDATALPRNCRYPERALAVLDLLINDREYFDLHYYGFEGVHYVLDEQGNITLPEGVSAQTNGFNPGALMNWNFRNMDLWREYANPNQWPDFLPARERARAAAVKDRLNAFQLNRDSIEAELAAIAQLDDQYMKPLLYGAADLSTLEEFRAQLRVAGLEKVLEEVQRQINEYADLYGY